MTRSLLIDLDKIDAEVRRLEMKAALLDQKTFTWHYDSGKLTALKNIRDFIDLKGYSTK